MRKIYINGLIFGLAISLILATVVSAENLLKNPGFEAPELTGWHTDAGSSMQTKYNPHSGSYSARGWAFAEISQAVPVTAGQAYNLSLWVMSPQEDAFREWGGAKLRLKWLDSKGKQIGSELNSGQIEYEGPHPWTQVTLDKVIVPSGAVTGKFICVMWAKDGAAQFDDASFNLVQ